MNVVLLVVVVVLAVDVVDELGLPLVLIVVVLTFVCTTVGFVVPGFDVEGFGDDKTGFFVG